MVYWKIINLDALKEHKVKVIELSDGKTILEINIAEIPHNLTVADFLTFLQEEGVILKFNK